MVSESKQTPVYKVELAHLYEKKPENEQNEYMVREVRLRRAV